MYSNPMNTKITTQFVSMYRISSHDFFNKIFFYFCGGCLIYFNIIYLLFLLKLT